MNYIGAHIDKQKTLLNTMKIITDNGGNALQFFASNPRSAKLANIDNFKKDASEILEYCKDNNFKLVIHSPYTINLAKELKNGSRTIDIKDCYWVELLLNELIIADLIGAIGSVVHVGKYTNLTPEEGLNNMRICIKYIIKNMEGLKLKSKLILETPAGQGTELLSDLNEFINFYNSFTKEERKYFKICIDTAHLWSSGYDILNVFNTILKKNKKDIAVIHFNNSKKDKGSNVDVHASIFEGKIDIDYLEKIIKIFANNSVIILEEPSKNIHEDFLWFQKNI